MADIINGSTLGVNGGNGELTDQPRFSISNVSDNDSGNKSVLVSDGTFSLNASVKASASGSYITRLVDLSEFKSDLLTIFDMNPSIHLVSKSIVNKSTLKFTIRLKSGMSVSKGEVLFKLGLPITLGKDISVITSSEYLKVSISNPSSYTVNYNNGSVDLMHYLINCNEDNGISAGTGDHTYIFGLTFDTIYTTNDDKRLARMHEGADGSTTVYSTDQIDAMLRSYVQSTEADFTPTVIDGANSLSTDSRVICNSLDVNTDTNIGGNANVGGNAKINGIAEVGSLKSNYIDEVASTGYIKINAPLDLGSNSIVTKDAIYYNNKIKSNNSYTIDVSKLVISNDAEIDGELKVSSDTTLENLTLNGTGTATFNGKSKFTSEFEINPGNSQSISIKPDPKNPSEYKANVNIPTEFSKLVTISKDTTLKIGDSEFYDTGIDIKNSTVYIDPTSSFIFRDSNKEEIASIKYIGGYWIISGSKLIVKNAVWNNEA